MGKFLPEISVMALRLAVALLTGTASALQGPAVHISSRRAILQKAITAAPFVVAAPALAEYTTPLIGTSIRPELSAQGVSPSQAAARAASAGPRGGILRAKPFVGEFEDPQHAGCKRSVALLSSKTFQIDGADEDGKRWKVIATRKGARSLSVDFSPKGGPADIEVVEIA